ncbi:SDR family NAD(P)-dependent oxidoreductase [Pseudomonas sp. ICMP22404]|uniref:SDR family NAD(P)-dependent oxidoreductase n=1 Tax=Pseudomonas sp. ICMP22404 TaxID=2583807 RepID=UPI00111987DE|nr:SDR family NAD(P)-dependent oxidoreductase [Pseudomonas sp. ICMP22404]TNF83376.1 SDR family NAD(P)-dependent oxidoreductase [Pseudomonas sp. ICMP22404]
MDINNKTAIVTGGASGLGAATVRRFVALGANVAIFDMNDDAGQALALELGEKVIYAQVNVADEASVQSAIGGVLKRFGAIHVCCNFAGIAVALKTVSQEGAFPLSSFQKVIDVNLVGTFNVLRLAAVEMARNEPDTGGDRGVIINTASIAAYEGQIGQAAYSASKGGVVAMTLPVARDLARYAIRVNTIVPGLIHTPMFDSLPEPAVQALAASPLYPQRLGRPDEVAHLAQFIVENGYLNGECIRLDAGIRMQPK